MQLIRISATAVSPNDKADHFGADTEWCGQSDMQGNSSTTTPGLLKTLESEKHEYFLHEK
jgi:hypothetical protein